jgi:ribosomal protein S18 acetylase RimI-like enzyme
MIKIVKAEESHVEAIGKLWLEFMTFHQNVDPIWTPVENSIPGFTENHLRKFMTSDDRLVFVAIDGKKLVGFSLIKINRITPGLKREKYGYIDSMAVTSSYRRKGVGEKMFAEIKKWFQLKDIKRVELGTTAQNKIGNSFWQKQGFTIYRHFLFREI